MITLSIVMTILAFAKKFEERNASCEILKFSTEFWLDQASSMESMSVDLVQMLELVVQVKNDSPSELSGLEIYLEKKPSRALDITSSYYDEKKDNQTHYTGEFWLDHESGIAVIDDIPDVKLPKDVVPLQVVQSPGITKINVQLANAVKAGNRIGLKIILEFPGFAHRDPESDAMDFKIRFFSESYASATVRGLFSTNKDLLIPARKILDLATLKGGFDIVLILPETYFLDYAFPTYVGPISGLRDFPSGDYQRKQCNAFVWRARLIFPSQDPAAETIEFGNEIAIEGRASSLNLQSAGESESTIQYPKNVLDSPPGQLMNDIRKGNTVFFVGSGLLCPPRYLHSDKMLKLFERERTLDDLQREHEISEESRGIASLGHKVTVSAFDNFVKNTWSSPKESHYMLAKLPQGSLLITSLFDTLIENAAKKREVEVVTGTDIFDAKFRIDLSKVDILLLKLLGDKERPATLCLSNDLMWDLRNNIRTSEKAQNFLRSILDKRSLVSLGFDSRDMYDSFFVSLIGDLSYAVEGPLTGSVYFVTDLDFEASREDLEYAMRSPITWINLTPDEFLTTILSRGASHD